MKLKQVNEGLKCPKCKKYTLISCPSRMEQISYDMAIMYDYICKNCNAKFIDEDLHLKGSEK